MTDEDLLAENRQHFTDLLDRLPDDYAVTREFVEEIAKHYRDGQSTALIAALVSGTVSAIAHLEDRVLELERGHEASPPTA